MSVSGPLRRGHKRVLLIAPEHSRSLYRDTCVGVNVNTSPVDLPRWGA